MLIRMQLEMVRMKKTCFTMQKLVSRVDDSAFKIHVGVTRKIMFIMPIVCILHIQDQKSLKIQTRVWNPISLDAPNAFTLPTHSMVLLWSAYSLYPNHLILLEKVVNNMK